MPGDAQGTSVPLSLFGGQVTEIAPAVLAEGNSPDNQDVTYLLGSVQNRPCASRLFPVTPPGFNPSTVYQKTFVQPNENPLNLFIDSVNNLWQEDVVNNPGVKTLIQALPAEILTGQSCTAFGREYIAGSDGFHGSHVPLQYDGTYLDRVTMDGPGQGPIAYDEVSAYTIAAVGVPGLECVGQTYETVSEFTESGYTVSMTCGAVPAGAAIGDLVYALGPSGYVGLWTITNITGSVVQYTAFVNGLSNESGSFAAIFFKGANTIVSGTETGGVLTLQLATIPVNVNVGDSILIPSLPNSTPANAEPGQAAVLAVDGLTVQIGPSAGVGVLPINGGTYQVFFPRFQVVTTTNNIFSAGLNAVIAGNSASTPTYTGTYRCVSVTNATTFICAFPGTQSDVGPGSGTSVSGGGTVSIGGSSAAGTHQVVCMWLTRQGFISKPSPVYAWDSGGSVRTVFQNLPIGPSNVVARILGLTGAEGDNFFYIPTTVNVPGQYGAPSYTVFATVIPDNVTTTATIDFADNSLFASTAIDIQGRNYFAQAVLGEVLGFFPYASRLFAWGERNRITNFLNMGFEGGYLSGNLTTPLGWTPDPAYGAGGGLVVGGAWASGMAWKISSGGLGAPRGKISQSAYQDSLGIAIVEPNTLYDFRLWVTNSSGFDPNIAGTQLVATLSSVSTGFTASAIFSIGGAPGFVESTFSAMTPATIPADLQLSIQFSSSVAVAITIDEMSMIPTLQPYLDDQFSASYVNAPEQFDGVTGVLGATNDSSQIKNCFELRNLMYFNTANGKHRTSDNGFGEPSSWDVDEVSQAVGSVSVHGTDPGKAGSGESGEQWEFKISLGGLYIFAGGAETKISEEIQSPTQNGMPGWDSINPAAFQTAWLKNDTVNRRLYIGVPTGTATAPNLMLVLDYRELNSAEAIASNAPYRESFSGRMIAKEFCRKWTRWNLAANCGEILARPGGDYEFSIGDGNGETPGQLSGFNNSYTFTTSLFTDDDYGQVTPYYTTYFFVSRDQEQQLGLDCHRKLASYLAAFISGVGQTSITPYSASLLNPWPALPAYPLSETPNHDFEWGMQVTGERIALKIGSIPLPGETDNGFNLQHLALTLKKEPMAPLRGAM